MKRAAFGACRGRDSGPAMRVPGLLAPLLALLLVLGAGSCHGLSFHLPPQSRKCLKEELHRDVMVTGEYEVSEAAAPGVRTDLRVSERTRPSAPPPSLPLALRGLQLFVALKAPPSSPCLQTKGA